LTKKEIPGARSRDAPHDSFATDSVPGSGPSTLTPYVPPATIDELHGPLAVASQAVSAAIAAGTAILRKERHTRTRTENGEAQRINPSAFPVHSSEGEARRTVVVDGE
jgi:hypothetical protein